METSRAEDRGVFPSLSSTKLRMYSAHVVRKTSQKHPVYPALPPIFSHPLSLSRYFSSKRHLRHHMKGSERKRTAHRTMSSPGCPLHQNSQHALCMGLLPPRLWLRLKHAYERHMSLEVFIKKTSMRAACQSRTTAESTCSLCCETEIVVQG